MAKPIKLGLMLEGEDAERFDEYMDSPPELSPKGKELVSRVRKAAIAKGLLNP